MKISDIETDRCFLKEIGIDDAEQIVNWRNDPEVYKYFKNPISIDINTHLNWLNNIYKFNDKRVDFIVTTKTNDEKIGVFGINRLNDDSAEVSYLLDKKSQGKGYASEALAGIENRFKKEWGISTFIAEIHKNNIKSISFIEKMGYIKLKEKGDFVIFSKNK